MAKKPAPRRRPRRTADQAQLDLRTAIEHQAAGRMAEAEQACRSALAAQPASTAALHVLAVVTYRQGRMQEALDLLQKTLRIDPHNHPAAIDFANMLSEAGDLAQATTVLEKVVLQAPRQILALNNLGVLLKQSGRYRESIEYFHRVIALDPAYTPAYLNLGYALMLVEEWPEATEAFETARRLEPANVEPIRVLSRLYRMLSRWDEAQAAFQAWAALDPADPVPAYMQRVIAGGDELTRAPADYVKAEFDRFAESFDRQLRSLDYRGPETVQLVFQRWFPEPAATRVVGDLGCGTGLAAGWLRLYARHLVGVDLSSKMLVKAAERQLYDQLIEGELDDFLAARVAEFDWLVAIDTFIYLGDLQATLKQAHRALRPTGILAFTIETANESRHGYQVSLSGRYRHSLGQVADWSQSAGFAPPRVTPIQLRCEAGAPVAGALVWCEKRTVDQAHQPPLT